MSNIQNEIIKVTELIVNNKVKFIKLIEKYEGISIKDYVIGIETEFHIDYVKLYCITEVEFYELKLNYYDFDDIMKELY